MLSETIHKLLNEQMTMELYSSYLYLKMGYEVARMGLSGFSHWFKCQAQEEYSHAQRIGDYLLDKDVDVVFSDIAVSEIKWECPCELMRAALEHEEVITERIAYLMSAARSQSDFDTEVFLIWFVKEQVEEESTLRELIKKLEMIGEDNNGLIFIDKKLHERDDCPSY